MTEVEFLPAWYPRKRRRRTQIIIGIYIGALVLVGAAIGLMWM